MINKATQSFFWPTLRQDIIDTKANCQIGMPSPNPAPPTTTPEDLASPFSHLSMGFFQVEANYLAIADQHANWLSVFRLGRNNSVTIIKILRWYYDRLGTAKEISSDGAKTFCSEAIKTFLRHRGVTPKVPSASHPRANKQTQLAVQTAKRLVTGSLGPQGTLAPISSLKLSCSIATLLKLSTDSAQHGSSLATSPIAAFQLSTSLRGKLTSRSELRLSPSHQGPDFKDRLALDPNLPPRLPLPTA